MTADVIHDPASDRCSTCDGTDQVAWSPAWEAWLCEPCRSVRADNELRITLAAKAAMQETAREDQ